MAQFRGTIHNDRGETSRLGTKNSGLTVDCDGWKTGVRVCAEHVNGKDGFLIFVTAGAIKGGKSL